MNNQPLPTPGQEDVTPVARELFGIMLAERERKGIATYGTTLQTHNGRDVLQDLLEELIDAWQYAVQARMEAERPQKEQQWRTTYDLVVALGKQVSSLGTENIALRAAREQLECDLLNMHAHDRGEHELRSGLVTENTKLRARCERLAGIVKDFVEMGYAPRSLRPGDLSEEV